MHHLQVDRVYRSVKGRFRDGQGRVILTMSVRFCTLTCFNSNLFFMYFSALSVPLRPGQASQSSAQLCGKTIDVSNAKVQPRHPLTLLEIVGCSAQ